ncbi:MAG TPA: hypothetical protein VIL65_10435 [Beijerinckiaceae bacterium]
MFTILRVVVVIGVLAWLSPARQNGNQEDFDFRTGAESALVESLLAGGDQRLEAVWATLPPETRRAVAQALLRSGETNRLAALSDTLTREDRQPAWRGVGRVTEARP